MLGWPVFHFGNPSHDSGCFFFIYLQIFIDLRGGASASVNFTYTACLGCLTVLKVEIKLCQMLCGELYCREKSLQSGS